MRRLAVCLFAGSLMLWSSTISHARSLGQVGSLPPVSLFGQPGHPTGGVYPSWEISVPTCTGSTTCPPLLTNHQSLGYTGVLTAAEAYDIFWQPDSRRVDGKYTRYDLLMDDYFNDSNTTNWSNSYRGNLTQYYWSDSNGNENAIAPTSETISGYSHYRDPPFYPIDTDQYPDHYYLSDGKTLSGFPHNLLFDSDVQSEIEKFIDRYIYTGSASPPPISTNIELNVFLGDFKQTKSTKGTSGPEAICRNESEAQPGNPNQNPEICYRYNYQETIDGQNEPSTPVCGYHNSFSYDKATWAYSVIPYDPDNWSSCINNNPCPHGGTNKCAIDTGLWVLGHEDFETMTDPNGDAWYCDCPDSSNPQWLHGYEIADLCEGYYGSEWYDGNKANHLWNGRYYALQTDYDDKAANGSGFCTQYGPNFGTPN